MTFRQSILVTILLAWLLTAPCVAETPSDWPRWRGPQDNGSIEVGSYPQHLDSSNMLWKAPLPGKGCSTPIVSGKMIYLTAPVQGNDALLVLNANGEDQWHVVFGPEDAGKHRNGSGSNASPVTDGDAVYVYFKSGTLAAVELNGDIRWQTNLVDRYGKDNLFWDHGTSPVLTERHVVMVRMHRGESWLAAFDKATGELAWKESRNYVTKMENDHGYTTPLVVEYQNKPAILVWGAEHVTLHDASNGKEIWSCGGFNPQGNQMWPAIATPVIVGDMAVIAFGRNDRNDPRLYGIRLAGSGDATSTSHVWERKDVGTFVPTPATYNGRVYLVRDRGEVACIDPAAGRTLWNAAFPKSSRAFYASPLIAAGTLYAPREDGVVFVATIDQDEFRFIGSFDLGEPVIGSPVPASNRIYVRGEQHLYCFAAPAQPSQ